MKGPPANETNYSRFEIRTGNLFPFWEATSDLVVVFNVTDHKICYLNRAGRTLLGIEPNQYLRELRFDEFYEATGSNSSLNSKVSQVRNTGRYSGECNLESLTEQSIRASEVFIFHESKDQKQSLIIALIRDYKQQDNAERERGKKNNLFQVIAENAADFISVIDIHGNKVYENSSYRSLLGNPGNESGKSWEFSHIHPEDREG